MQSSNSRSEFAKAIIAVLTLLASAACSDPTEADKPRPTAAKTQWRQLDDGSFAEGQERQGSVVNLRRCWKVANGYDCLILTGQNANGSLARWQVPVLPQSLDDPDMVPPLGGYACDYLTNQMAIVETAFGPDGRKRDNAASVDGRMAGSRPWSAAQAATALRDVGSTRHDTHFDCMEIASVVFARGMTAFDSPAISQTILD